MPTLLILTLVLLVATCVIAYWSDNLGKKLGKKRISLFGLRPRQTATFISMGSSVGIMLLTLGALLFSNQSVRNALTRYDLTKKENRNLLLANSKLRDDGIRLANASDNWQKQTDEAKNAAQKAEALAKLAQGKANAARADLGKVRLELMTAQSNARDAISRAAAADRQTSQARANLRAAESKLQSAEEKLQAAADAVRQRENKLRDVSAKLRDVTGRIADTNRKLADSRRALDASNRARDLTIENLNQTKAIAMKQIDALNIQLGRLKEEEATLLAEKRVLFSEVRDLQLEIVDLKGQREELFKQREEISSGIIDPEIPVGAIIAIETSKASPREDEARALVQSMLKVGEAELKKLKREMALSLVQPRGGQKVELPQEQLLDMLVASLRESNVPVSVRLVVAGNHAPGENPVRVRFFTIQVSKLFDEGDVIANTTIENGLTDAKVFGALEKLINAAEVRTRNLGASPILTKEEPHYWPSGTGERVFEALRRIQALGSKAEVQLVAARDISSIGPMQIRFDVKPAGE